jgi:hypothetical protein
MRLRYLSEPPREIGVVVACLDAAKGGSTETGGSMVTKMLKFGAVAATLLMTGAAYAQAPTGGSDQYNASSPDRMGASSDAGSQPHRGINGPKPGDRSPGQRAAPAEKSGAP